MQTYFIEAFGASFNNRYLPEHRNKTASFALLLKICDHPLDVHVVSLQVCAMEMVMITGPGKILDRNPADMEISGTAALGGISPSGASSPSTPLFSLPTQKIFLTTY